LKLNSLPKPIAAALVREEVFTQALFQRPESLSALLPYDEFISSTGMFRHKDGSLGAIFEAQTLEHEPLTIDQTVAAVNGVALGGGCELATFCDVVIASETAKFGQPEIKVGVFPSIATVVFPYLVGKKKAMELILTGEAIEAKEALSLGLVNRVVPADKLDSAVKEFASKVTLNSGPVLQMMKKTMLSGEGLSFQDALKSAQDIYLNQLMALEDTNEGLQAFVERRAPVWKDK